MSTKVIDRDAFLRIYQEHIETRELITTLLRVLAEKREPGPRLYRLLMMLKDHLVSHFREEEDSGVFNNLGSDMPHPQDVSQPLMDEHPALLEEFFDMLDGVDQTQLTRYQWTAIEDRFRQFTIHLMEHETRENDHIERAIAAERELDPPM